MLQTLGALEVNGRAYSTADLLPGRLRKPAAYGLEAGWYGGRADWIAETDGDVLLVLSSTPQLCVIDTAQVIDDDAEDEPEPAPSAAPATPPIPRGQRRSTGRRRASR